MIHEIIQTHMLELRPLKLVAVWCDLSFVSLISFKNIWLFKAKAITLCSWVYNTYRCVCVCARAHVHAHTRAQSCPTLCNPVDCSPPGSSVHGISQARILEWTAISSSRRNSWPKDRTCVSCIGRQILYHSATWETHIDIIPTIIIAQRKQVTEVQVWWKLAIINLN